MKEVGAAAGGAQPADRRAAHREPRLETATVSSQGAIGLMQVMHFHAGEFDCESDDLLDVESNICHGARVFGRYLKRTGNVKRALLRYNGCVVSANTPNCHRYPAKVIRAAGQVRRDLLAYPAGMAWEARRSDRRSRSRSRIRLTSPARRPLPLTACRLTARPPRPTVQLQQVLQRLPSFRRTPPAGRRTARYARGRRAWARCRRETTRAG